MASTPQLMILRKAANILEHMVEAYQHNWWTIKNIIIIMIMKLSNWFIFPDGKYLEVCTVSKQFYEQYFYTGYL